MQLSGDACAVLSRGDRAMSANEPRPHQRAAIEAIEAAWARGVRRPAIPAATGTGKTTTFSALIGRWLARRDGRRALVVAHRIELIEAGAQRLHGDLGIPVGVVMAERNQTLPRVVVGSVATLRGERRRRMLRDVGLVVVDECHHAPADSYTGILRHYGALDGDSAVALGVTATMSRGDDLALGDVWEDVVHQYPIAQAVADGWLKRPVGIAVRVADLDLRRVKTSGGEYRDGALGAAMEGSLAPKRIAEAIREHAAGRQGFVFAPTVHAAEVFRDAIRDAGFTCELVHAGTPAVERRRTVQAFRDGHVSWLANCGIFTEGTDLPMASCVVIGRPCLHSGLFIQMAGRGARLWCPVHGGDAGNLLSPCCDAEQRDMLVLDVVGASKRHSLSARVELFGAEAAREIEAIEAELTDEVDGPGDGCAAAAPDWVDAPTTSEVVDLFGSSDSAWLRTHAGVWFLQAGERYIAIIPAPDGWPKLDVVAMHRHTRGMSAWVCRGAVGLAEAMARAEGAVTPDERLTASKRRSWRRGGASGKQLALARSLGLAVDGTAGALSDQISVELGSRRIDPHIPAYVARG